MNESSSRNGDWAESTNHHVLLSWTQYWLWQPFASPLRPVSASPWWLPIYWPWLCSCCLLPILCHQLQKLYPSSPFTSVEQYLRYVNQTKFWLATIIVFKSCYTICSLDCLWLYRTYIFTWGEQVCYTIFSGWLASSYFSHLYLLYLWKKKSFFGCNKCYQHWSDMCSATACVQQLSQPYSLYYFYRTIIGVFKTLSSG